MHARTHASRSLTGTYTHALTATFRRPYRAWRVFWAAVKIIAPLLYKERVIAPWHLAPRQETSLIDTKTKLKTN